MATSKRLSEPRYEVVEEKDVPVAMRDGTVLRANVHRPKAEGRFPVLIERTPYDKEAGSENAVGSPQFFGSRGYVVVIQDVRGRFASEGEFYPFRDDGWGKNRDGYDTVEWAAAQPWSDGNVGTIGGSYSGATQYRNVPTRPPHLRAMFIRESSADYHSEWVYRAGAFELGFSLKWALGVTLKNLPHLVSPKELERSKGVLEKASDEMDDWYRRLPLAPCPVLEGLSDWYNEWLEHPDDGPYWWQWNIETQHAEVDTPVYHLGGLFDGFQFGTLKNYMGMKKLARSEKARQGQKLILGPWVHGPTNVNTSIAGGYDFGSKAAVDFNELRLPWFDHWLKGMDTGIMDESPVRLFLMGRNEWLTEKDWPLPDTRYTPFYLHGGKSGTTQSLNDGTLSAEAPGDDESPDSFLYDPYDPVPSEGGATLALPNGVYDQSEVERRCLTYTSEPLTREIVVAGPTKAVLYGLSSALDTDWIVRLCDVHPEGYSRNVADGILRARYRESLREPKLLTPGKIEKYEVDMWAASNAFQPGHRIRITVTSSCFPRFDRNLNTGAENMALEPVGQKAVNTVFHDGLRPTHVLLPVVER